MADRVHRITMFKIPGKANQQDAITAYGRIKETNQKNGKPYILSIVVGSAEEDTRSQGYTIVCKTEFANMEDMRFYDESCPAHAEFKETAKTFGVEGLLTIYFKPSLVGGPASK